MPVRRRAIQLHLAATSLGDGQLYTLEYESGALGVQLTGDLVGLVKFQATLDGESWVPILGRNIATGQLSEYARMNGIYVFDVSGCLEFKAELIARTSGALTAVGWFTRGSPRNAGLASAQACGDSIALTNGVPYICSVPSGGVVRIRARIKATVAGTLSAAFLRPDGSTAYEQNNPADVAVTGGTETLMDISHYGESRLQLTFLPGANGTLNYLDVSTV